MPLLRPELAQVRIAYEHQLELAPTTELRQFQRTVIGIVVFVLTLLALAEGRYL